MSIVEWQIEVALMFKYWSHVNCRVFKGNLFSLNFQESLPMKRSCCVCCRTGAQVDLSVSWMVTKYAQIWSIFRRSGVDCCGLSTQVKILKVHDHTKTAIPVSAHCLYIGHFELWCVSLVAVLHIYWWRVFMICCIHPPLSKYYHVSVLLHGNSSWLQQGQPSWQHANRTFCAISVPLYI